MARLLLLFLVLVHYTNLMDCKNISNHLYVNVKSLPSFGRLFLEHFCRICYLRLIANFKFSSFLAARLSLCSVTIFMLVIIFLLSSLTYIIMYVTLTMLFSCLYFCCTLLWFLGYCSGVIFLLHHALSDLTNALVIQELDLVLYCS